VKFLDHLVSRLPGAFGVRDGHGFSVGAAATLPTCEAKRDGEERRVPGGAGVADRRVICEKDAADAYAWTEVGLAAADARYLNEADNLSDLDNAGTARTNLGLVAGGAGDIWVEKGGDTMTGDLIVPDEAYGAGWNASLEVPTKNAVYDKIESVIAAGYTLTVQEEGVTTDATVNTLNFDGSDFNLTESPEDAITIALNYGTAADQPLNSTAGDARYQPLDADLTTLAANITAAGHALVDDASAADQRTTLGLVAGGAGDIWVEKGGDTMTGDLIVPDEAYDATAWNGSLEVPTKNAVRDKIEALAVGGTSPGGLDTYVQYNNAGVFGGDAALTFDDGTGAVAMTGALTVGGTVTQTNAAPGILQIETGGSADEGAWQQLANAGILAYRTVNDALDTATTWLQADRTGNRVAAVTVNPDGLDSDFVVEGDTDADLVHVDASTDRVGIGTASPSQKVEVVGTMLVKPASGAGKVIIDNSDGSPAWLEFYRSGAAKWIVNSDASDIFGVYSYTTGRQSFTISNSTGVVTFNQDGADQDTIVEGDTDANLLFVDAGLDSIGIGTNAPTSWTDLKAGTTARAPLRIPSGTNLTTPIAGVAEYDGASLYWTNNTTSDRGVVPAYHEFLLTADGSAISTIADFFGATSSIDLPATSNWLLEADLFFLKTTNGTIVLTITNSAANYTGISGWYSVSAAGGIGTQAAAPKAGISEVTTAAAAFPATASLTNGTTHHMQVRAVIRMNAAGNIRLRFTASAGSATPQSNSWYSIRRLPGNTGAFVA
jgi:hypothetical protein